MTEPVLVTVRGNSASGKSTLAAGLRERYGRGLALVGQDMLRREVLRERDVPGGANIDLIALTARHALAHGFHVVVEGIMASARYGAMLTALLAEHPGPKASYYLDVPFDETLRRHAGKAIAGVVTEADLRSWYLPRDLLPGGVETVIPVACGVAEAADLVFRDSGLAAARRGGGPVSP
ncbi:AAA family ATPase [Streptomyces sp. NPDC088925]|uniref:AAA family ATPase n=1 Tax=Streptomyces sp. NPDC088925 TaxID=3365914 RepID=UPI003820340F